MSQPATIYARFSNAEQARGSSLDRQLENCHQVARLNGWEVTPERIRKDEGLSAFSGSNRKPGGQLYEFEQEVEQGRYLNGHVLIVEHLDRISRQGHDEVLPFLTKLTQGGVTVATVDGGRIYPAFERVPLGPVIEAVVKSELAYEESKKKSVRLTDAWQRKVETAQATNGSHIAITSTVPAWLNVDPTTKRMTLNEDRVRVLREIFQLTIDGFGTPAIAKRLNARGERVWKHRNVQSKNGWTVGYLTKIVLNRAVLGEYRPTKKPRGVGHGTPRGITVLDYYPQAIDPITFAKANAARVSRTGTSGSWQITHGNLLSGIARCSECGGRMAQKVVVRKGQLRRKRGEKGYIAQGDISYLSCNNATNKVSDDAGKRKCEQTEKIRYELLERTLVQIVANYAAQHTSNTDPARIRELEGQIAEARRQHEGQREQADNLARSFANSGSAMMERLALDAENAVINLDRQIAALVKQLDGERSNIGPSDDPHGAEQAWFRRIQETQDQIYSEEEQVRKDARVRMKQVIARIVSHASCDRLKQTHIVLGQDAVGIWIDGEGNVASTAVLQDEIIGPDGQRNWHPDQAA